MKKIILLLSGLLTSYLLFAQKEEWGLLSSLNLNHISGDGMAKSNGAGYSAGAYAQIKLFKKFSVQPQFLFMQRNIKASNDFKSIFPETATNYFKTDVRLNYISIPLLLNYQVNKSWSFNFGPEYSRLMSSDEKLLKENQQSFQTGDFSLIGGVQLQLSSLKIFGQYNYGVYNLNAINSRQWYSRGFEVGVGWRLAQR